MYVVVCFLIKSDIGQKQWKRYLDHHSGRHNFQIDLALFVMNYETVFSGMAIQMKDQTLCDKTISSNEIATNVFFCLNGITTGIAHPLTKKAKVTVEYECGTCVTTNKCTDVRVSLGMVSGSYCRMCYRKELTTELSATERRKTSRTSAMGCPSARSLFAKSAGKRGTINMHNFT